MNESREHEDRLIDQALHEMLGEQVPPDLAGKILAACQESPTDTRSQAMAESPRKRGWKLLTWAIAASALFCLGVLARPSIDDWRVTALSESDEVQRTSKVIRFENNEQINEASKSAQRIGSQLVIVPDLERNKQVDGATPRGANTKEVTESEAKLTVELAKKRESVTQLATNARGGRRRPGMVRPQTPTPNAAAGGQSQQADTYGVDAIMVFDTPAESAKPHFIANGPPPPTGLHTLGDASSDRRYIPSRSRSVQLSREYFGYQGNTPGSKWPSTYAGKAVSAGTPVEWDWRRGEQRDRLDRSLDLGVEGLGPGRGGDQYDRIYENPFLEAKGLQALSTFSIDVDTASYTNVRQFLNSGKLPPADAVRLEELINYFSYQYAAPSADTAGEQIPFAAHVEVAGCPWAPAHKLVRIGVKGQELAEEDRPLTNLVFLIDVSGSMQDSNKLPLVIEGMKALTRQLGEKDRVAIVVYASQEGLALESTPGDQQEKILSALDRLSAGGSTAGGAGIRLAYQLAEDNFIKDGVNRVILCTDGDFNVGTTSTGDLERLVVEKAKNTGVFLSVCGFGRGNLNDAMMETISGKGNGNYFYVDSQKEAEKVFVKGLAGTLVTIAKDVKIQVEFNPRKVAGYRLLGYENRMLAAQDFNDDKKDAGEIGAGHTVTALYEIVPAGEPVPAAKLDELRYQQATDPVEAASAGELLTLKMRYKQPDGDTSTKHEWPVSDADQAFESASEDFRFAAAAAGFGMLLRESEYAGQLTWDQVVEIAQDAKEHDPDGYRTEFVGLVNKAQQLRGEHDKQAENEKNAKYEDALEKLEKMKQEIEKLRDGAESPPSPAPSK